MKIAAKTVVTLEYKVRDADGRMIDEGAEPMVYVHGGKNVEQGLFPKLQAALEGKSEGDEVKVTLEPLEAFGEHDEELVMVEPREFFPKEIEEGIMLERQNEDGSVDPFLITEIGEDHVTVDGNHPLAGRSLVFSCKVVAIRQATDQELDSSVAEV
ncbi:MAG: peptidylprolyl isomerase [Alphaproteobacteria bacterium]|nr:peptidylprolyl isomerase [Alphaproteobacteria bacterium]